MKFIKIVFLYLFILSSSTSAETIDLVIEHYPPYINSKSPHQGFLSQIITESFKRVNIDTQLKYKPWRRIEVIEIDENHKLSFAWIWNKERGQRWFYSEGILSAPTVFYVRKELNFSWKQLEDLKPYRIGISRGYSYGDAFDQYKSNLRIDVANTDEINIKKIIAGRIDLFPTDPFVGASILRRKFTLEHRKQIKIVSQPSLTTDSMHVVCAKSYAKCPYYLIKFNEGMHLLTRDGTKQSIISQAMSTK